MRADRRVLVSHAAAALAISLPWPLVLVMVAEHSHVAWQLGVAGSARMLPYVAISWLGGRLADVVRRDLVVRVSLVLRGLLLVAAGLAVLDGRAWTAVLTLTLAVAVSTPSYPALVAALPGLTREPRRATELLVTIEVAAFVVGSAFGGLLLRPGLVALVPWLSPLLVVVALVVVAPVSMPRPVRSATSTRVSAYAALRRAPAASRAIALMAVVNFVDSALALALLPLALGRWHSDATGYGLATAVLGFAGLAAPLLRLGTPGRATVRGLVLLGIAALVVAPTTGLAWSLVPLALVGSASVVVEAAATGVVQDALADEVTASVLGLTDTVIVGAALLGALVAPPAVAVLGGVPVLLGVGALALGAAGWARLSTVDLDVRVPAQRLGSPVGVPAPDDGMRLSGQYVEPATHAS